MGASCGLPWPIALASRSRGWGPRAEPTGESATADALEREIIDMLRRDRTASAHKLRSELADGPAVTVLAAALAAEGLLRSPLRSRALRVWKRSPGRSRPSRSFGSYSRAWTLPTER